MFYENTCKIFKVNMRTKSNNSFYETKYFIKKVDVHKRSLKYYIKCVLYPFLNLFYKCLSLFLKKPLYDKPYDVAIVAIFKNEAPFLKEWIDFHLLIGVNHLYLYNNNSTDCFMDVLSPYIEKGVVTLIEWPEIPGQISSYKHWYTNYRNQSQWVTFLDLDEFICPFYDNDISSMLKRFLNYPALMLYWKIFGTSGIIRLDEEKYLIEQNVCCWNKLYPLGKIFYNTDYDIVDFTDLPHSLRVKYNGITIPIFNDSGNAVIWPDINLVNKNKMCCQVNHYISRSYESIVEKIGRGSAAFAKSWKTMDLAIQKEYNCKAVDYTIHRFLLQLKIRNNKDI